MVDGLKLVKWAIGASTGVGGSKHPLSNSTINDPKTCYITNTYKHKDLPRPHEQKTCSAGLATEDPVPPAPNHPPSPLCGDEAFFGERAPPVPTPHISVARASHARNPVKTMFPTPAGGRPRVVGRAEDRLSFVEGALYDFGVRSAFLVSSAQESCQAWLKVTYSSPRRMQHDA